MGLGLLLLALPVYAEPLAPLATTDDWKVVDVGMAYTEAQKDFLGSITAAELLHCAHVAGINETSAASKMKVLVRLVGQTMIPTSAYVEPYQNLTQIWHDVNDSDTNNAGPFAGLRDLWGADTLFLSVSWGGGMGGGPYAVVGDSLTLTAVHEFGHCLGMNHSPGGATPKCADDDLICQRSHGFVGYTSDGERFCDVMGLGCERRQILNIFSNPSVFYKGMPVGEIGISEAFAVGEEYARNIQNWKASKAPSLCAPDPGSVYLMGGRYQLINHVRKSLAVEGRAVATKLSDTKVKFTFANLKPTVATLSCVAGKLTVKVTGPLPKAVMRSLLVLDTTNGTNQSFIKPSGVAFKPSTTTSTLSCN